MKNDQYKVDDQPNSSFYLTIEISCEEENRRAR